MPACFEEDRTKQHSVIYINLEGEKKKKKKTIKCACCQSFRFNAKDSLLSRQRYSSSNVSRSNGTPGDRPWDETFFLFFVTFTAEQGSGEHENDYFECSLLLTRDILTQQQSYCTDVKKILSQLLSIACFNKPLYNLKT